MGVKTGKDNMTRKVSVVEKKKVAEVRIDYQKAERLAPSWEQYPGLADDLPVLAAEYLALNAQIKEIEKRKSELKVEIETIQEGCEVPMVVGEFFAVERVTSHRPKKVSPTRLLENGVNMEVIEDSYEGGEEYSYIQIRSREEKE